MNSRRKWQERLAEASARFERGVWEPEMRKFRKRGILPMHRRLMFKVIQGGKRRFRGW